MSDENAAIGATLAEMIQNGASPLAIITAIGEANPKSLFYLLRAVDEYTAEVMRRPTYQTLGR